MTLAKPSSRTILPNETCTQRLCVAYSASALVISMLETYGLIVFHHFVQPSVHQGQPGGKAHLGISAWTGKRTVRPTSTLQTPARPLTKRLMQ